MTTISPPRSRFLGGEEGRERNGSWRGPQTPPQLPVSDPVIRFALLLTLLPGKRAISPLVVPFPINRPPFLNRKKEHPSPERMERSFEKGKERNGGDFRNVRGLSSAWRMTRINCWNISEWSTIFRSGVAVSCGECSSSGTSDITEPGSPCSTSSDEGVAAVRGASASPLPSLPKLAPSSQLSTRPQWPWTPPLAATACSTYKRLKGEPEAGALPRSGAADPGFRGGGKSAGKPSAAGHHHHHHESQGKITEYFKTQIKPQQPKVTFTFVCLFLLGLPD